MEDHYPVIASNKPQQLNQEVRTACGPGNKRRCTREKERGTHMYKMKEEEGKEMLPFPQRIVELQILLHYFLFHKLLEK
ncbi:hypothetical protein DY000_02047364 [Brassica cretica]|uniref:Uncharacterized protein n=1 Tax=Brassica cretica TaxID=69181 RepID=A0ABQ7F4Y0_BRACR|nr:hypothetical protein DY000_02047364 [Brassica cretica]